MAGARNANGPISCRKSISKLWGARPTDCAPAEQNTGLCPVESGCRRSGPSFGSLTNGPERESALVEVR